MASIIQIRRDSASNWTSTNPTLASGELGLETDTSKLKAGDGATAWTSLGYYTLGLAGYAIGTDVQAYNAAIMVDGDIGSTVQAYDADTTKNDVANTFTATQTLPAIKLTTGAGADKVLTSDAAGDATWAAPAPAGTTVALVSGTTQTAVKDTHYTLTNAALTTVTLPASPASGDTVWVTPANSVLTNVIARNGQTIMDIAQDLTIDVAKSTVRLRFTDSSWRLV